MVANTSYCHWIVLFAVVGCLVGVFRRRHSAECKLNFLKALNLHGLLPQPRLLRNFQTIVSRCSIVLIAVVVHFKALLYNDQASIDVAE